MASPVGAAALPAAPVVAFSPPAVLERRRSSRARKTPSASPPAMQEEEESKAQPLVSSPVTAAAASSVLSGDPLASPSPSPDAVLPTGMPPSHHADLDSVSAPAAAASSLEVESSTQEVAVEQDVAFLDEAGGVAVRASETVVAAKTRKRKAKEQLAYDKARLTPQALVSQAWVGCHVSTAGGVSHAIENAHLIGARAFAMDLKSKRKWISPPMSEEEATTFREKMVAFQFTPDQILPHGSYLQNIGCPNEEVYEKSKANLLDELVRCKALGLTRWNFHPGAATGGAMSKEDCMRKIASTLNWAHAETKDETSPTGGVVTVLENMAGQGNVIGGTLEELKFIIDLISDKRRVGVCIDTCHAFAAGYDLRTPEAVRALLDQFDRVIGYRYLYGLHLNDSKGALHCRKDRHESIGRGHIGLDGFRAIMNAPQLRRVPMILETPCPDPKKWVEKYACEIGLLYSLEAGALPDDRPDKPVYVEPSEEEVAAKKEAKKERQALSKAKKARQAAAGEEGAEDDEEMDAGEEDGPDEEEPPPKPKRRASVKRPQSQSQSNSQEAQDESDQAPKKKQRLKKTASTSKNDVAAAMEED